MQQGEIPTFSFYIDWFTGNYKDQSDSNLPDSGENTEDIVRGRNCWGICIDAI